MDSFGERITTIEQLRSRYREPSPIVQRKKFSTLLPQFVEFIGMSTFCVVSTVDADGNTDASPRGGAPGFVRVLDDRRLLIPDLIGNNLLDSITNIVETGVVAVLFVVPGEEETVRVNGRAVITVEPELLSLWSDEVRTPRAAIGIEVTETYHHCAKAFRRGGLWQPDTWPSDVPDFCVTYVERFDGMPEATRLRELLEDGYSVDLDGERAAGEAAHWPEY